MSFPSLSFAAQAALWLDAFLARRWVQGAIFVAALVLFWLLGTRPAYS